MVQAWFSIVEAVLLFLATLALLLVYARRDSSWLVLISVFASWYLAFAIIVALPLDIYFVSGPT